MAGEFLEADFSAKNPDLKLHSDARDAKKMDDVRMVLGGMVSTAFVQGAKNYKICKVAGIDFFIHGAPGRESQGRA
eukprot:9153414-Pyramimonas_sp.AAC.1